MKIRDLIGRSRLSAEGSGADRSRLSRYERVGRQSGSGSSTDGFQPESQGRRWRRLLSRVCISRSCGFTVAAAIPAASQSRGFAVARLRSRSGFSVAPSHAHGFAVASGFAVARLPRRVHVWLMGERQEWNRWAGWTESGTSRLVRWLLEGTSTHGRGDRACRHSGEDGPR